jgi:hypothetical protein
MGLKKYFFIVFCAFFCTSLNLQATDATEDATSYADPSDSGSSANNTLAMTGIAVGTVGTGVAVGTAINKHKNAKKTRAVMREHTKATIDNTKALEQNYQQTHPQYSHQHGNQQKNRILIGNQNRQHGG